MGPESAARACELLGVRQVVPMHDGMFPLLTGNLPGYMSSRSLLVREIKMGETGT